MFCYDRRDDQSGGNVPVFQQTGDSSLLCRTVAQAPMS